MVFGGEKYYKFLRVVVGNCFFVFGSLWVRRVVGLVRIMGLD